MRSSAISRAIRAGHFETARIVFIQDGLQEVKDELNDMCREELTDVFLKNLARPVIKFSEMRNFANRRESKQLIEEKLIELRGKKIAYVKGLETSPTKSSHD